METKVFKWNKSLFCNLGIQNKLFLNTLTGQKRLDKVFFLASIMYYMKSKIKSCITVALSLFFVIVAACFTTCSNSSSSSDDPVSQERQPQNPPQVAGCSAETPCPAGQICISGQCVDLIEGCANYDTNGRCRGCAEGYTLINGICVQNPQ